jgi:NAD(P)-dependent dehydrogenase (short-subunit alcohol dehydrogenase family)
MAEAVRWGRRGARVNTISPGIIFTPLAVATVAALLMGPDGAFITGSDELMDGGVTASYFFGELAPQ